MPMNAGGGTFARALALQRDQSLDLRPPRRRASSEHCRVRRGVLCVVWGTPVASAQTKANRVKAAGALGVLVGRFDHITSTCSPAYNTSNVALLTPRVFILLPHTSEDAESTIITRGRRAWGVRGPPGRARPAPATAATTRCVVHLERSLWRRMRTPQARCTGLPDSSP